MSINYGNVTKDQRRFAGGAGLLFKVGNSRNWRFRVKLPDGRRPNETTGTPEFRAAKQIAEQFYEDEYYKFKFGIKDSPKVQDVIYEVMSDLISKSDTPDRIRTKWLKIHNVKIVLTNGKWKKIYADYLYNLHNMYLPLWKDKKLNDIKVADLDAYVANLQEKLNKVPASSTLSNHISTYNTLKKYCQRKDYVSSNLLPQFSKGDYDREQIKTIDYFNEDEINKIFSYFPEFIEGAHKKRDKIGRAILQDLCLICLNTGCRGTIDCKQLKWSDMSFGLDRYGSEYIRFNFKGKNHPRQSIGKHGVKEILIRIKSRHQDLADKCLEELFVSCDQLVFGWPDTKKFPVNVRKMFRKLLEVLDLRSDSNGNYRKLYSWRATYATRMILNENIDLETLTRQMGTSAKMMREHYLKITAEMEAHKLSGTHDKNYDAIVREDGSIIILACKIARFGITYKPGMQFDLKQCVSEELSISATIV